MKQFSSSYAAPSFYSLLSLTDNIFLCEIFLLRLLIIYGLHWFSSTLWLHISFSESTSFCKVMAWAAHITLWVVYVNNNNKNAWSFIPVSSSIPLTSFQLEEVLSMADFFLFLPTGNFQPTVLLHLISWLFLDLRINYWNVSDALWKCQCIWLDLLRSTAFQPTWYWNWISSSAFLHTSFSQATQKHTADDLYHRWKGLCGTRPFVSITLKQNVYLCILVPFFSLKL